MKCSDEISIGDYVRTRMGTIGKFKYYGDDKENIYFKNDRGTTCVYEKEIVKHSPNIIDLVEQGDYVNGKRVIKANCRFTYIDDDSSYAESEIENGLDLGKEQIKEIEFRIKE